MTKFPVFNFRFTEDNPIPFEIFRIEEHPRLVLTGGSDMMVLSFAVVMLVLDIAAMVVLFPKLSKSA